MTSYGAMLTILGILVFTASPYSYLATPWTPSIGFFLALVGLSTSVLGSTWTIPRLTGKIREIAGGLIWSTGFVLISTLVLSSLSPSGFVPPIARGGLIVSFPLICVGTLLAVLGVRMIFYPSTAENQMARRVFEDSIDRAE